MEVTFPAPDGTCFRSGAEVYFLAFSLRWLMSKDRSEEALQSLSKLRRLPASDLRVKLEHLGIPSRGSIPQRNQR